MFKWYQNGFLISLLVSDFQKISVSVESIPEARPCIIEPMNNSFIEIKCDFRLNLHLFWWRSEDIIDPAFYLKTKMDPARYAD